MGWILMCFKKIIIRNIIHMLQSISLYWLLHSWRKPRPYLCCRERRLRFAISISVNIGCFIIVAWLCLNKSRFYRCKCPRGLVTVCKWRHLMIWECRHYATLFTAWGRWCSNPDPHFLRYYRLKGWWKWWIGC